MRELKVLHVAPNYPPEFRGGVERHVETLAAAAPAFGVTPIVACGSEVRAATASRVPSRHAGVDVFRLHRRPGDDYSIALQHEEVGALIEELLERVRPDLVHLHHWFNVGLGVVRRCTARAIPVVVTLHDVWTSCPRFFRVVAGRFCELPYGTDTCGPCVQHEAGLPTDRLAAALVAREREIGRELSLAAAVTTPSEALREFLAPTLKGVARLEVVPHGVAGVLSARAAGPGPVPPWRIGGWGSVVWEKGLHLLVSAAQALAERGAVEVHWWGHAPDPAYVHHLRELDRAGALRLHGSFVPEELPAIAGALHVGVFPSICFESFGLAVEEALALRVPVVVSDRGAPARRVAEAGLVVPPDDVEALRTAIESLLENRGQRRALADAPRRIRTSSDVARDLAELYREILVRVASRRPPITPADGGRAAADGPKAGSPPASDGGDIPPT